MAQTMKDEIRSPGVLGRDLLGTGMPAGLMLGLVALGLPRTVLEDLGVVAPESSWVYYMLALTPFAAWLAVAVFRRTATPIRDHLVTGALYGLSLIIVHEALWVAGPSAGPEAGAVSLARGFGSPLRELVLHGYTVGIAMMIGLGVGAVAAVVATAAKGVRTVRSRYA